MPGWRLVRRAFLCPFLKLNISETTGDMGLFTIGSLYRKVAGQTIGDITDDIT